MDNFDERNPTLLHEISSVERAELSLLTLTDIFERLDQEQSLICSEAYAAAGPFFGEYPSILKSASGAVLLADITERKNRLSITWYWDYSNVYDEELSPSRPTSFPPLSPSVFRYPKSSFQNLDEPIRSQAIGIEAAFSSFRKRYVKLSAIRKMLVAYKGSVERNSCKEALSARQLQA